MWLDVAERWRPAASEALRLRVWLASPTAYDVLTGVAIEGALQWIVVARESGRAPSEAVEDAKRALQRDVDVPIPIEDVEIDGKLIARASTGVFPLCAVETLRYRRKRARVDMLGGPTVKSVIISGGAYKSLNAPIATATSPFVDFFVRGDRTKIEDLLVDFGGLARDRARGLGASFGVEVSTDPEDRSLMWQGAPQRPIPIVMDGGAYDPRSYTAGSFTEMETGYRAPYWRMDTRCVCAVPHVRVGAGLEAA